jgi:hypothetical protein
MLIALLVLTPTARPTDEKKIQQAIDRGVEYLRRLQGENGDWRYQESGMTSLAALTLLECDVPTNDTAIQKAAAYIRNAAVNEDKTYSLALAIMFLDRLGEAVDVALIEAMAARLLSGQMADGGWSYKSGSDLMQDQQDRLKQAVLRRADGGKGERRAPSVDERRTPDDLSREAKGEIDAVMRRGPVPAGGGVGAEAMASRADNSNTQFAILALWTARRYGVPVDAALKRVEERFRRSQNPDGGWGYLSADVQLGKPLMFNPNQSTAAMTCAALLGLAMHYVAANENTLRTGPKGADGDKNRGRGTAKPREIGQDAAVKSGFAYLAGALNAPIPTGPRPRYGPPGGGPPPGVRPKPGGQLPAERGPQGARPPKGIGPPQGEQPPAGRLPPAGNLPPPGFQPGRPGGAQLPNDDNLPFRMPNKDLSKMGRFYYFLWSMERAAVAYGLDKIGGKSWYTWGADFLVTDQEKDGSWQGVHGSYGADTCFALLFLRRADLAKDLSASLKNKFKGSVELIGGGVGFKGRESIKPIRSPFEDGTGSGQEQAAKRPNGGGTKPTTTDTRPSTGPAKPRPTEANVEPNVAKLSAELVDAPASKWGQVLAKLRDGKGPEYTQALAHAITQLDGDLKKRARQALAERLSNLKSSILPTYMEDDNPELRRAAALACAMKEDVAHVGNLIALLNDRERAVERAAYAALKELTKKDFGPAADATDAEKAEAIKAWKDWWKKQAEK